MATVSLDLTVTAGEATRIQAAYQQAANVSVNGTASQPQVLAFVIAGVRQKIVDDVKAYEKGLLLAAVADPVAINPS